MNGSENGYAGALFFALISLGALFKLDDVIGLIVGAASALFSAISLRRAMTKAAQAAEEDHQRMEIQLQQLRSKIMETSAVSIEAMNAIIETAHLLQDNLQVIRVRLAELDNLTPLAKYAEEINASMTGLAELREQLAELNNLTLLAKHAEEINTAVASLEENSVALNAELEKIIIALQTQEQSVTPELVDELKQLNETDKSSDTNLQTVLKLLQVIGQMLKNPSYAKDLDELKTSVEAVNKELSELVRINGGLSKNFTTTIDDLRIDVARLTERRETHNTPRLEEPQPVLSEHDLTMLKRIVAKINLK